MSPIEKVTGPCVILAGAGTGKTHTIVEKIKYLIAHGIYSPERVVCITFSKEAAKNLFERVQKALSLEQGKEPIIRTFHAFSAELLRKHGASIGISPEFKILDTEQAMVLLHRNLKVPPYACQQYIATIGSAKDLGISLEDVQKVMERNTKAYGNIDLQAYLEQLLFELHTLHVRKEFWKKKELQAEMKAVKQVGELQKFVTVWNSYEKMKHKGNYQDYADLNVNALRLLQHCPEIAGNFDSVIVDEFQDTNKLQLDVLLALAPHQNITIVGDSNQSIYRFRGAYTKNLALFKKSCNVSPEDVFTLARSYRSPNTVLHAAHRLILQNYSKQEECLFVENAQQRKGEKIEVYEMNDAREEARKVVEIVERERARGVPLEELCVLYRVHQYGRILKRALANAGIPHYTVSKSSLLKQPSVKTAHDYLIILNKLKKKEKGGEQAWWDLLYRSGFQQRDFISLGKFIKKFTANRRGETAAQQKKEREAHAQSVSVQLFTNLDALELSEHGKAVARVLLEKIKSMLEVSYKPIAELLQEVFRIAGLANEQKSAEEKEAMMNLKAFHAIAKSHEELYDSDLASFLYYLDILQNLGIDIEAPQLEEKGVRLMSSHATKGLEFKTVIVTNFAQGRFPLERWPGKNLLPTELLPEVKEELQHLPPEAREEYLQHYEKSHQLLDERRLAYVSFTRAKEKLVLTYAMQYNDKKTQPSVFLQDIDYRNNPDIAFTKDSEHKYQEHEETRKETAFSTAVTQEHFEDEREMRQRLSPSALLLFSACQKEFEYRYIYHMPERKTLSWEAMRLGSFVHLVLERGVRAGFSTLQEFLHVSRELSREEEWRGVENTEAETLIRVFFERHKMRYTLQSKTEQYLQLKLAGIDFMGFADRIDFHPQGIEIVDYKTGKGMITPQERNWQLGFYALAAQEKYGKVRKVLLDMLKQERPLEFELDEKGNAVCISSKFISGFNIRDVERELLATAHAIQDAYKRGFKPCAIEKNCNFCNEYVYGM